MHVSFFLFIYLIFSTRKWLYLSYRLILPFQRFSIIWSWRSECNDINRQRYSVRQIDFLIYVKNTLSICFISAMFVYVMCTTRNKKKADFTMDNDKMGKQRKEEKKKSMRIICHKNNFDIHLWYSLYLSFLSILARYIYINIKLIRPQKILKKTIRKLYQIIALVWARDIFLEHYVSHPA